MRAFDFFNLGPNAAKPCTEFSLKAFSAAMKSRTPSFVIELGLKTGEDQESALETYFSDARQLFNAVLGTAKKRVRAMKSTEA